MGCCMSRVFIATGKVAKTPYRLEKIERNIYSIEELCYSLVQSAQFLDTSVMDPALVDWISNECGLPDLAAVLRPMLGRPRALTEFVSAILGYAGYVSQDKQIRTKQIVASGQGMEPFERILKRAEYLRGNGQVYQALEQYEALLEALPAPERSMRRQVYCRMGGIYTGLFRFRSAAECFGKAYDLLQDPEVYLQYLAAVRFSLSDAEYVSFVSEHPESYNASMELERRVRAAHEEYEKSAMKLRIARMKRYRAMGQETSYETSLHEILQELKDDYRKTKAPSL